MFSRRRFFAAALASVSAGLSRAVAPKPELPPLRTFQIVKASRQCGKSVRLYGFQGESLYRRIMTEISASDGNLDRVVNI